MSESLCACWIINSAEDVLFVLEIVRAHNMQNWDAPFRGEDLKVQYSLFQVSGGKNYLVIGNGGGRDITSDFIRRWSLYGPFIKCFYPL